MSTISQTPKVDTARGLNIRNLNLLIAAALVIAVLVVFASIATPAAAPVDQDAYMLYRQGEWRSVPSSVSNAEAYQIFRLGETTSVNATNASVVDLTAYHFSERTMVPALFSTYQLSEWFGK